MSSIFADGALHPGRDPNDAWWIVVRRPEEWGDDPRPGDHGTRVDPSRMVLELAPMPLAEASIAPPSVTGPDGTRYVLDAFRGLLLRQRPCDDALAPLRGVGGAGSSTGRFDSPVALALDDRGWIYVVDRGNDRVQVIDPSGAAARVAIVLDGIDDPVSVAIGPTRVYVATVDGWIHSFDRQFRRGPRFRALRPGETAVEIVAIAATGDDLVVVAESGSSRLVEFDCRGGFVGELGAEDAPPVLADVIGRARFVLEGTRVVGPIDGGIDGIAWHQVVVDAALPAGTSIEVQTWAADAIAMPPPTMAIPPTLPTVTPWAPAEPVAMPAEREPRRGEIVRPVMPDTTEWMRWRGAPYRRGATFLLAGDGPDTSATFDVPYELARRLREDDDIELASATDAEPATIGAISDRAVSLIASIDRVAYGDGCELWLLERGGRALDPVRIGTVPTGAVIDLGAILVDGGGADVAWPHTCAALVRRGDVLELRDPVTLDHARVEIEAIDPAPATITLTAAAGADYRTGTLRIVDAAGRLVLEHAEGWGDGFPAQSSISVAHLVGTELQDVLRTVAWSDPELATVWTDTPPPAAWISISPSTEPRATDRGRYLWVKLRLRGARRHPADVVATATPVVRSLRVLGPRLSYLSYLPAVFGRRDVDTPTGSVFLERFLAMFEGRLTGVESRYELVARLLNPFAADDEWLDFVASWFDLVLDPTWPRARRAALLAQIFELYRIRGTREGILRFIEAYTGHRPQLIEGFQVRPRAGMVLGCAGVLGCAPLGGIDVDAAAAETLLAAYAHRFTLVVQVDDECDLDTAELSVRALVEAIKPAHADVDLRVARPIGRIGFESMIGVDFVLGADRHRDAPLGGAGADHRPAPILGVDATLLPSSRGTTPPLDDDGAAVGDFTIR